MSFCERGGFARLADLEDPDLVLLLEECRRESMAFTGSTHLDWSRQWEYPWVLGQLEAVAPGARVLDAGSGYRFFTPLLARKGFEVLACDRDATIGPRLDEIAAHEELAIDFEPQNLESLGYPDEHVQSIVSVSVLEHTSDPKRVLTEFHRCLVPGGLLLLTFDLSVDGRRDIPLPAAVELIQEAERLFDAPQPFWGREYLSEKPIAGAGPDELLRTTWFREHQPELLPWRFLSRAWLKSALRLRLGRPFFDLCVIGLALQKRPDA